HPPARRTPGSPQPAPHDRSTRRSTTIPNPLPTIASPDGHCRVFDARAGGSIVGGGVGMAGRGGPWGGGSGGRCGQGGGRGGGVAAASVEGQGSVIGEAVARSGVGPEEISYVEAHGTGTTLGDPIEVEALKRAFAGDERRKECALGSVKSNLGHLATAAGVAG